VSVRGAQEEFCHLHDPSRTEERRRSASRAGRAKGNKEVAVLKDEIKTLILALERQIRETDELAAEIEALKEGLNDYGAA
jgi:hypothetical protein